jgi:hypothetical protein
MVLPFFFFFLLERIEQISTTIAFVKRKMTQFTAGEVDLSTDE